MTCHGKEESADSLILRQGGFQALEMEENGVEDARSRQF
jgi:hypothetical protein